jgi:hypothetical protein
MPTACPKLWIQEDHLNLTYVFDGATSALLKTIESPGPLGQRSFIGTVRQTAAPEMHAYLFASEFGHNVPGLTIFLLPRPSIS